MLSKKGRIARGQCEHQNTITVRNGGIERTVCESCGHFTFRGLEGLSGKADRSNFERGVERTEEPVGY
jgi:hypothetical protein